MPAPLQAVTLRFKFPARHACTALLSLALAADGHGLAFGQAARPRTMPAPDQAALQHALDTYDAGNLQAAEPALLSLAIRYPLSFEANEALGSLYAEQGEVGKALPYLKRAVTLSPGQAVAHANLGAAYLTLNEAAKAVQQLETAAQLEPDNPRTLSNLGKALVQARQPAAAAHAFGKAVALTPEGADVKYNLALALQQSGDLPHAAAALETISPGARTAPIEALAADIDEQSGHFREAVAHYQAAAHLDPSAANIYALTLELLRHWTWGEAREIAAYGTAHFPADTRFRVAEGIALYADSKYPQAAALFSSLLADEPNNAGYADLLGRSCDASPDTEQGECANLEQFALRHPENARVATFAAARILQRPLEQQDSARAERLLTQAVATDPKLPEAYYQLGILAQQRLAWQDSVAALEKAIALRPSYAEAHYRLSRAYAHLGQREQAQQQIALQQQYSQQEKESLNTRMQEVVTFLLKPS